MKCHSFIVFCSCMVCCISVFSQDPRLPSVNLGFTNMQAGNSRPPGWYFIQYTQTYHPKKMMNEIGVEMTKAPLFSSLVLLQQIAFISEKKVMEGNLGFTLLLPVSKTSVLGNSGVQPTVNPNPLGDLVAGAFVQWYDKRVFGLVLAHRFGLNVAFPTGGFQTGYAINPGAHRYRIIPNYQITLTPFKHFAISIKNNLYYSFKEIRASNQVAIAYNANWALEFALIERLVFEAAGYYLTQLGQDIHDGSSSYYHDRFGITDTRERVIAYGPGIGYRTKQGVLFELKSFWEEGAKNRSEGFRATLLMSLKL